MKKGVLAGIITAVAVITIGVIVIVNNNNHKTSSDNMANMNASSGSNFSEPKDMSIDSVQTGEVKLDIRDYAYSQKTVKIKKGTKVTWTNQDSVRHDITPDSESAAFTGSELLPQGQSYSFTFNTVGTYTYHCSPHPYMKGSVEVVE